VAGFIQVVEFEAKDVEAVADALNRFRDENPGAVLSSAATIAEDRDRPGTFVSIVLFDSYEQAITQSQNPATDAFSKQLAELMSGPPRFRNLDVRAELTNP
jgi:quinol monooxygenase YgiN